MDSDCSEILDDIKTIKVNFKVFPNVIILPETGMLLFYLIFIKAK